MFSQIAFETLLSDFVFSPEHDDVKKVSTEKILQNHLLILYGQIKMRTIQRLLFVKLNDKRFIFFVLFFYPFVILFQKIEIVQSRLPKKIEDLIVETKNKMLKLD